MTIYFKDGQVLFDSGSVAMSENCCCVTCSCGPAEAVELCDYATADGQGPSDWSVLSGYQVDVTGTCTHRAVRDPTDSFDVCTPSSCPCPSGSWVIGCTTAGYRIAEVVCEDASYWYYTEVYFGLRPFVRACSSNVKMFEVYLCSETFFQAKTGSLPAHVGAGWQSVGFDVTGCGSYGNTRHDTWKNFTTGYNCWGQDLTGSCTEDCATPLCVSDFPNNITLLSSSAATGGRRDGGCVTTGLSFTVTALS